MRTGSPRNRVGLPIVIAIAYLFVVVGNAAAAEPLRTRGGSLDTTDKGLSREQARSVNHVTDARLEGAGWEAILTDGDDSSKIVAPLIAVRYPGAVEWTNEIELRYRGAGEVTINLLGLHGKWDRGSIASTLAPADDWATVVIPVPADRYQGFSLELSSSPGKEPIEVSGIGAYWFEVEMTKDAIETADEWAEDYPGTGSDLTSPNETAQRFSEYLDNHGWTWVFDYGNDNCWEEDFKRNDLGGTNNSYIDATDAFIYCGHGSTDILSLANSTHDDGSVSSGDIHNAWGDTDLEWAWFHCCLNLSSTSWASALAGTHTIAGAINVINGSSNWGKTIAQKLIDNGVFDSAWSIYSSWWHSNDTNQPAGNKFRLLAEDEGHYNEVIWGQGTVLDDSNDSTHWTVSQTVAKSGVGRNVFDPEAVQRASEPIVWTAPAALGKPGEPGMEVRVHPEVLRKSLPQSAMMLDVLPAGLDDAATGQMLGRLCEELNLDCANLAVGREGAEGYAAASGLACLSGDIASGGWMFTDQALHTVPGQAPEVMLTPSQAAQRARGFLQDLGLIDANSFIADVRTLEASTLDENGGVIDSFPFAYDVVIARQFGPTGEALPMVGNGGRSHVALGVDGSIQAFNQVSRRVQPATSVDLIPLQAALDQLAAFGYASLQSAPEFRADAIVVRDANVGYFEQGISSAQTRMGPAYYMDVDLIGPDPRNPGQQMSAPGRIFLAADTLPVKSAILAPGDGGNFPYGQQIAFRGDALHGTPPYQFRWSSDVHGPLSNQQNFVASNLNPSFRESGVPGPITIELRVTDANGYVSTDQVAINITGVSATGDVPPVLELTGNHPNPFNPRTTISFGLPAAGHANLRIIDLRGTLVRELVDEALPAGRHARIWDGTDASGRPVASGVYLYRLGYTGSDGEVHTESRRMVLVR